MRFTCRKRENIKRLFFRKKEDEENGKIATSKVPIRTRIIKNIPNQNPLASQQSPDTGANSPIDQHQVA